MQQNKIIEIKNISKHFQEKNEKIEILKDLNLDVYEGEKIAIVGPSGSGKSTLLFLLSGLDKPDSGEIWFNNKQLSQINERGLARYRNEDMGFIFQSFELILPFTVKENISVPLYIANKTNEKVVNNLIESVMLQKKANSPITNLSGGEKQRVAIARALVNNPKLILADEPTGSLDNTTGKIVLDTLITLVNKERKTLIIITHDINIASMMDKVYLLKDKKLELQNANKTF